MDRMPQTLARPTCFAAEAVRPILSRTDEVVQCRIEGGLRPAEGSKCCGEYSTCKIWRVRQRLVMDSSVQKAHADAAIGEPSKHVIDGAKRG